MTDRATSRPWRAAKPVHATDGGGWRVTIHAEPIPAARALGVTRKHAVANAAMIVRVVNAMDRLDQILAAPAADHEEMRKLQWLKDRLGPVVN
jgi:hypothetical protein